MTARKGNKVWKINHSYYGKITVKSQSDGNAI